MSDNTNMPSSHLRQNPNRPTQDFIEAVLIRPTMYTIDGTLEEVAAFLQGFYSGMIAHTTKPIAQETAQNWFDFCEWATQFMKITSGSTWYHLFQAIRQQYPEDLRAFERVFELYVLFQQRHKEDLDHSH